MSEAEVYAAETDFIPPLLGRLCKKYHFHAVLVISCLPTVEMTAGLFRGFHTASWGERLGVRAKPRPFPQAYSLVDGMCLFLLGRCPRLLAYSLSGCCIALSRIYIHPEPAQKLRPFSQAYSLVFYMRFFLGRCPWL